MPILDNLGDVIIILGIFITLAITIWQLFAAMRYHKARYDDLVKILSDKLDKITDPQREMLVGGYVNASPATQRAVQTVLKTGTIVTGMTETKQDDALIHELRVITNILESEAKEKKQSI